jgi:PPOX class probable F420-dependent enzyme
MSSPMPEIHPTARALVDASTFIWLTTVRRDGQPQASPVWFVFDGEEFLVYSRADAPRLRNIGRHPRVAITTDSGGGRDVVSIEAVARIVDAPRPGIHTTYVDKYRGAMESMGYEPRSFFDDYPIPIYMAPTRWRLEDVS